MEKILVYMKDENYKEKLIDSFNRIYGSQICLQEAKSDYDLREGNLVVLTDIADLNISNKLIISEDRGKDTIFKYQGLDMIYNQLSKLVENSMDYSNRDLILLFNLNFVVSSFKLNTEIAKSLSKEHKTLLINMNEFSNYDPSIIGKGLEDLLIFEKIGGKINVEDFTNIGSSFDYINSCEFPLKLEFDLFRNFGKLTEILRESSYRYLLFEGNFSLNDSSKDIIKYAKKCIWYIDSDLDKLYIKKALDFLDQNYGIFHKSLLICIGKNHDVISNCYTYQEEEHAEFIKLVGNFVRG